MTPRLCLQQDREESGQEIEQTAAGAAGTHGGYGGGPANKKWR